MRIHQHDGYNDNDNDNDNDQYDDFDYISFGCDGDLKVIN